MCQNCDIIISVSILCSTLSSILLKTALLNLHGRKVPDATCSSQRPKYKNKMPQSA